MVLEEVRGDRFIELLVESPRLSLAILRQVASRLRTANALPRLAPRHAASRPSGGPRTPPAGGGARGPARPG
jgi:hypothetical protein